MTDHDPSHPQDGSFAEDLRHVMRRRVLLGGLAVAAGGAGAWGLFAAGRPPSDTEPGYFGTAADGSQCVKSPGETNGPYPADGTNTRAGQVVNVLTESGLIRHDIRTSFAGLTPVADGVALELELALVDVDAACGPLPGWAVYVWHCDGAGDYSIYSREDCNYLRGMQVADTSGIARFTTIFPGAYEGRWPHIHFEVFRSAAGAAAGDKPVLTGQIALPGAESTALYASDSRYARSVGPMSRTSFAEDNIFGDNTPAQQAAQMLVLGAGGATGRVTVGLRTTTA